MRNQTAALIVMAVVALGSLAFAWRQHARLQSAREVGDSIEFAVLQQADQIERYKAEIAASEQQQDAMRAEYQRQLSALQSDLVQARSLAERHQSQTRTLMSELQTQREAARALADRGPEAGGAGEEAESSGSRRRNGMQGMMDMAAEVMKNPEMKKIVEGQQRAMLDMTYGSLLEMLNLQPEQAAQFKDLLVRRQMDLMEAGLAMADATASEEQRAAATKLMESINEQYEHDLAELLGEENVETVKAYESSQPERMQVNMFNQTLPADLQLTPTQQDDFILALYEARAAGSGTPSTVMNQSVTPDQFSPDAMANAVADSNRTFELYAQTAQSILTPKQFAAFQASLDQQKAMQEMALQMFGNAPESPAEAVQ